MFDGGFDAKKVAEIQAEFRGLMEENPLWIKNFPQSKDWFLGMMNVDFYLEFRGQKAQQPTSDST